MDTDTAATLADTIANFLTEGLARFGSIEAFQSALEAYNAANRAA